MKKTLNQVWVFFMLTVAGVINGFGITFFLYPVSLYDSGISGVSMLLCAIFGGLISGIGSGLTIRFGGAMDGIDILSVLFAKRLGLSVGMFVMIFNVILYVIAGVLLSSWVLPLYSIITYAVAVKAVDFIAEGLDKAKSAVIITTRPKEICGALSKEFGNGITILSAKGYYSDSEKSMIYFVVNRFQISKVRDIVREQDEGAYVTISEVSDVLGREIKAR